MSFDLPIIVHRDVDIPELSHRPQLQRHAWEKWGQALDELRKGLQEAAA